MLPRVSATRIPGSGASISPVVMEFHVPKLGDARSGAGIVTLSMAGRPPRARSSEPERSLAASRKPYELRVRSAATRSNGSRPGFIGLGRASTAVENVALMVEKCDTWCVLNRAQL